MHRTFSKIAALIAMASVIIGAFGAHYLKSLLTSQQLDSIETATYYQFIHALGLFHVANNYKRYKKNSLIWAGYAMVIGIILFSGSIYLNIFLNYQGYQNLKSLNLITPVGGTALIISWILLFTGIPVNEDAEPGKREED
jgi:uncharacterized membrane protein YgdD (TMEM256/DUF423 family)